MLVSLAKYIDDSDSFSDCLNHLKNFYYPETLLIEYGRQIREKSDLKHGFDSNIEVKVATLLERTVKALINSGDYGYPILCADSSKIIAEKIRFPYMERYIYLFLKRKYNITSTAPFAEIDDLFALTKGSAKNYSKNAPNFNHFINVVMCLARLIQYFSINYNHIAAFNFLPNNYKSDCKLNTSDLAFEYSKAGNFRIFKLMLAGFYHDLGKTIIDQRHSIEGEILILADRTSTSLYYLHRAIEKYKSQLQLFDDSAKFEGNDLSLVSKMLLYHDQFGTLGTGEDGYLRLVNIVDFIKMLSLNRIPGFEQKNEQLIWSTCTLFDLWVLNIADIMVSIAGREGIGKFDLQDVSWSDLKTSVKRIQDFFDSEHGHSRIHDLKIACRLLFSHFHRESKLKIHVSDNTKIIKKAVDNSRFHTTERLRRLISSSLRRPLKNIQEKSKSERTKKLAVAIMQNIEKSNWVFTIERSLEVLGTAEQFKTKFSWIGKMDYSLGFFEKIALETIHLIDEELTDFVVLHYDSDNISHMSYLDPTNVKIIHKNNNIQDIFNDERNTLQIDSNKIEIGLWKDNIERNDLVRSHEYELWYSDNNIIIKKAELLPINTTSWIRERTLTDIGEEGFLYELNAQFFMDNYTITIIEILSYLLNREIVIDSPKDFEFLYAKERLNKDKIRKIASMVGPFQSNKSVHYILQNIYIY